MKLRLDQKAARQVRLLLDTTEPTIIEMCREVGEDPATFFEGGEWSGLDLRPCGDLSDVSFRDAVMDGVIVTPEQEVAIRASGPRSMHGANILTKTLNPTEDDAEKAYDIVTKLVDRTPKTLDLGTTEIRALNRLPPNVALLDSLKSLYLTSTSVKDLTPLAGLTGLEVLSINNTAVSNLASLLELKSLHTLILNNTVVDDLGPISGLRRLQSLHLENTLVSDLTPLASLMQLRELRLDKTLVNDLHPISGLAALQRLSLTDTSTVKDLAPLSTLRDLQQLFIARSAVTDLSPLQARIDAGELHVIR